MAGNRNSGGHNRKSSEQHTFQGTDRADRGTKLPITATNQKTIQMIPIQIEKWVSSKLSSKEIVNVMERISSMIDVHLTRYNMSQPEFSLCKTLMMDTLAQYIHVQQLILAEGMDATLGRTTAITVLMSLRKELRTQMYEFCLTPRDKPNTTPHDVTSLSAVDSMFGHLDDA